MIGFKCITSFCLTVALLYTKQNGGITPEFYDDDIPLLLLGSETPAIYFDEDNNENIDERRHFYGLLQAAGMTSDSKETLKRSARQAMNLLKWLLIDWKEVAPNGSSNNDTINMFGKAFVSLPVVHYKHMNLHLHVTGNEHDHRGGAKEDACSIIAFILSYHRTETYERAAPVLLEEVVLSPVAQQSYELWSARPGTNLSSPQQELIKKNALQRQAEIALQQRQEAVLLKQQKQLGGGGDYMRSILQTASGPVDADFEEEDAGEGSEPDVDGGEAPKETDGAGLYDEEDEDDGAGEDDDIDELDVMAAMRKRQKSVRQELRSAGGHRGTLHAVRWADSRLAREMAVRERALQKQQTAATTTTTHMVRDSADALQELQAREEEKAKILGKDPLGIHHAITDIAPNAVLANVANAEEYFDLRYFEVRQGEQIEMAIQEVQEDVLRAESMVSQQQPGADEILKKHLLQKASLEQLMESLGGLEMMDQAHQQQKASILPTRPTFNPLLFLTILHRRTAYKDLLESMERLSGTWLVQHICRRALSAKCEMYL
jgi:hypothetical protein